MKSTTKMDGLMVMAATYLVLFALPALAVVQQAVEFPDAENVQSATLSFDDSDEVIAGAVQDEDGGKKVIFILPDGSEGRSATVQATVDGERRNYSLIVGRGVPAFGSGSQLGFDGTASGYSGWFFGGGVSAGTLSSDFATRIAQQSALDAEAFLVGQGVTNIMPSYSADDSASTFNGIVEFGYLFADQSRLFLDVRAGSVGDYGLNVDVAGDLAPASVVNAQSVATAELDIWSINLNYSRFFTPSSNFGFLVFVGSQSVERPTSFTSTILVDGAPIDSFSGGETLDENVMQYGFGLEWTKRNARNWMPTVGVRIDQTAGLDILDNEKIMSYQLYLTIVRAAR